MLNKDPIRLTSIVITFVICLTGAALSFWIYLQVIQNPKVDSNEQDSVLQVDTDKLKKAQTVAEPSIALPVEGYGRSNPFVPYKPQT